MTPYYADEHVTLYHGDCREILPALGVTADCIVADPPYGETDAEWDRWPRGWLDVTATITRSLWCFGSLRMYLEHADEFKASGWKFGQDVIWQKNTGSGLRADRFRRIHEQPTHWYQGPWGETYHQVPRIEAASWSGSAVRRGGRSVHLGKDGADSGAWTDDGTRLTPSVISAPNLRGKALHPTEKPLGIISPLIEYACPPGGLVLDSFAGSGSILDAARQSGRRAIGVELYEPYAEKAARRLSQMTLEMT